MEAGCIIYKGLFLDYDICSDEPFESSYRKFGGAECPGGIRRAAPFETYKKEAVGSKGMVATNHPLGSAAGLEMLAMGGNAMDAAVASVFALSVVEPMMVGIFGAGFINYYDASNEEFVNIDNYSVAPAAAAPDMYETVSDTWPDYMETEDRANLVGYRSVGVPGALKGGATRRRSSAGWGWIR